MARQERPTVFKSARTGEARGRGGRERQFTHFLDLPLKHLVSRIWEKKYGKGAKHLQKREESDATHDTRTLRTHFKRPQANRGPRLPDSPKRNSWAQKADDISKKHTSHLRRSEAVDDRPLHPSWIAKMRMKEKSNAAIVPSQGKRIKFED